MKKNYLYPGFEFMGISNDKIHFQKSFTFWSNLTERLSKRYLGKSTSVGRYVLEIIYRFLGLFGYSFVKKWRFETWNEPDLHLYNVLNFTVPGKIMLIVFCFPLIF